MFLKASKSFFVVSSFLNANLKAFLSAQKSMSSHTQASLLNLSMSCCMRA